MVYNCIMRWNLDLKNSLNIGIGSEKIEVKFAFLPVFVGNTVVWLETYKKHYIWKKGGYWELRKVTH